jgi:putative toxin-antitoxin system antitoxin component (TIGR02293 family)
MRYTIPTKKSKKHAPANVIKESSASVVADYIHPDAFSAQHLLSLIQRGLPVGELDQLRTRLGLTIEGLTSVLGISPATFHRRKAEGRLAEDESDRVLRFARILALARDAMGDEERAREWLTTPQLGLGGATPLEYARTEVGAREVENLLGRIEHGVY